MMGAEPGKPYELSPITRIDTAPVRPVQRAAGRSFIEPGSPWQNPFVSRSAPASATRCSRSRLADFRRNSYSVHYSNVARPQHSDRVSLVSTVKIARARRPAF
jgi:hypothetical protein